MRRPTLSNLNSIHGTPLAEFEFISESPHFNKGIEMEKEEITVFLGNPQGYGNPIVVEGYELKNFFDDIANMEFGESFVIKKTKITREELDSLEEHQGW